MEIWRIHLKPDAKKGIDPRQFCINNGIVGVGWGIYEATPVSWEKYLEVAKELYKERYDSWWYAIDIMKNRMHIGDTVWTRDNNGYYFLGRITGDWFYDASSECSNADIINVRKCEWYEVGTVDNVPGKIVNSFIPPATVQRINNDTVKRFSKLIYNKKSKNNFYEVDVLSNESLFDLLSSDDCEDALAIYLQEKYGYYLIPSSCKRDTMGYEYVLINAKTGKSAVAQVKSGNVPLNIDDYSEKEMDVYLFATNGKYYGTPKENVITIDPETIRKFLYEQTHLLSAKMKVWVEMTR